MKPAVTSATRQSTPQESMLLETYIVTVPVVPHAGKALSYRPLGLIVISIVAVCTLVAGSSKLKVANLVAIDTLFR